MTLVRFEIDLKRNKINHKFNNSSVGRYFDRNYFVILPWFQNRGILGFGKKWLDFDLGCQLKQKLHILP